MQRTMRLTVLLMLISALAACGFKLRQATEIPPEASPMYVQADEGSKLGASIREALIDGGIEIATTPSTAKLVIRVLSERESSRLAAVNADGKVIANELIYSVTFDAAKSDGSALTEVQSDEMRREHVNPADEVLGKAEEVELIRADMVRAMTERVFDRLKALLL